MEISLVFGIGYFSICTNREFVHLFFPVTDWCHFSTKAGRYTGFYFWNYYTTKQYSTDPNCSPSISTSNKFISNKSMVSTQNQQQPQQSRGQTMYYNINNNQFPTSSKCHHHALKITKKCPYLYFNKGIDFITLSSLFLINDLLLRSSLSFLVNFYILFTWLKLF
jgi:hypothetical protein